jgi:hypothetical protein
MARISGLTIIHTTAYDDDADTDADFQLQVARPGGDLLLTFPDLPHDEREGGRTDQYFFDLSGENVDSDAPGFQVIMRILSSDGWLPSSIFVIGHTPDGGNVVLGSHPTWTEGWFDSGDDPAGPAEHAISGLG